MSVPLAVVAADSQLSLEENRKRTDQRLKRPRVYEKIQRFSGIWQMALSVPSSG